MNLMRKNWREWLFLALMTLGTCLCGWFTGKLLAFSD